MNLMVDDWTELWIELDDQIQFLKYFFLNC